MTTHLSPKLIIYDWASWSIYHDYKPKQERGGVSIFKKFFVAVWHHQHNYIIADPQIFQISLMLYYNTPKVWPRAKTSCFLPCFVSPKWALKTLSPGATKRPHFSGHSTTKNSFPNYFVSLLDCHQKHPQVKTYQIQQWKKIVE